VISSAVHKIHLQEKPWGPSALFTCRQPVFCPHPFCLFLIAKGEEELSKDLAQMPGRESLLRVAGGDTAVRGRGEGWKARAEQTLSFPFFPFQGESMHFSTPTFLPGFQTPPALYQIFQILTHIRTPFPKHPPQTPHHHKLL